MSFLKFNIFALFLVSISALAEAQNIPPEDLKAACAAMNQVGNIDELRGLVRQDMTKLRNLLEKLDHESDFRRVEPIAERLKDNMARLNKLVGPKYAESQSIHTHNWDLGPKLLWLGEGPTPYWKITEARVVRVYNWSTAQEDPLEWATLDVSPYQIIAHLQRPTYLVEYCQFPHAVMVTIEFDVESPRSHKTLRRNLLTQSLR